jgi:hypothetical protein
MPRTDRASRVVAAPHERVHAALLDPEALTAWRPPGDMIGWVEPFDARPGGAYRMVLTDPDASNSPGNSTQDADIVQVVMAERRPERELRSGRRLGVRRRQTKSIHVRELVKYLTSGSKGDDLRLTVPLL